MNTRNIRSFDSQGRITISHELAQQCKMVEGEKIAICMLDEKRLLLRKVEDIKDCRVIGFSTLNKKGRIIIPKKIRNEEEKVAVYLLNGDLILETVEEAH